MNKFKKVLSLMLVSGVISACCSAIVLAETENYDIGTPPEMVQYEDEKVSLESVSIINVKHDNTVEDIVEKSQQYPHSGFSRSKKTSYKETPNLTSPYSAGSLEQSDIDDAANTVKMVRFLAGLPYEEVNFPAELNNIAQSGAVLLAASNQFDHYPAQPSDMSDEFFKIAYRGCSQANISAGRSNISNAVLGFMYDDGDYNIDVAGHRRWILNPANQEFGIGYANSPNASYQGDRINMHIYNAVKYWGYESDSYISWPAAGAFPIQYFTTSENISSVAVCPWSINLGAPYSAPAKENITLKLTRRSDEKTWIFDKNTPNLKGDSYNKDKLHLSCDDDGAGIGKAIVFRPDLNSLGAINDGDTFTVELSGITYTDGSPATLSYDINFFDLDDLTIKTDVNITVTNAGVPVSDASVTIDGQTVLTDSDGNAKFRLKMNSDYSYIVQKDGYNRESGTVNVGNTSVTQSVSLTKPVKFSVTDNYKMYNGEVQGVSVSSDYDVPYTARYTDSEGNEVEPKNAGTYNVTIEANSDEYSGSSKAWFSIYQADIAVTADSISKKENTDDPQLTFSITSGQLYGDDQFTGSLVREQGEDLGVYIIRQGTLSISDNYRLKFNIGLFRILENPTPTMSIRNINDKWYVSLNNGEDIKNGTYILAAYDEKNRLKNIEIKPFSTDSVAFDNIESVSGGYLKAMLWSDVDKIQPLIASATYRLLPYNTNN